MLRGIDDIVSPRLSYWCAIWSRSAPRETDLHSRSLLLAGRSIVATFRRRDGSGISYI